MRDRIDQCISEHVISDVMRPSHSSWRITLHLWLILTHREAFGAGFAGIAREFSHS